MTDNTALADDQTSEPENLTDIKTDLTKSQKSQIRRVKVESVNENVSQIKDKKNQTDNIKWSIFTEAETKVSAGMAAKKAGLKLNEWIDTRLRQAAIDELTKKSQPPAKPEDLVADIVKQFADQMQASQAVTVQAQNDLIEKQGQQIAALAETIKNQPTPPPPPSLKELIFGRSNK